MSPSCKCEILRMSMTTRMVMIITVVKINYCVLLAKICCQGKGAKVARILSAVSNLLLARIGSCKSRKFSKNNEWQRDKSLGY